MLIAHYTGPAKPGLLPFIGHWLIKTGQKAPFDRVTHTEAIHALHEDGQVTIASSSIADGGVRTKVTRLNPGHWIITNVQRWPLEQSKAFFSAAISAHTMYDAWGAAVTMLPGKQKKGRLFCTESVLAPFVPAAHYFTPAEGLAICLACGTNVTESFFADRPPS